MKRTLQNALSIFVLLLLAGTVMAQTGSVDSQPAAEPTASSDQLSPAESGTEATATAPDPMETTPPPSTQQEAETEPLPKTASPLPLIAAVGLLAFGTAVGLGYLRQRATKARG